MQLVLIEGTVMRAKPLLVFLSNSSTEEAHMPLVKRGELLSPLLLSLYGFSFWYREHCSGFGSSGVNIQEQGKSYLRAWQTVLNQLYRNIPFSKLEFMEALVR